jgi:hypothetical protein
VDCAAANNETVAAQTQGLFVVITINTFYSATIGSAQDDN